MSKVKNRSHALTSNVVIAIIFECGLEVIPHPPYSTDLAPYDFHLFPNVKKALAGRHFANKSKVMDAVKSLFNPKSSFQMG